MPKVDRKTAEAMLTEHEDAADAYQHSKQGVDAAERAEYRRTRAAVLDAMVVPEGWVLVPKVPTDDMLEHMNGCPFVGQCEEEQGRLRYAGMLAAVPQKEDKP